MGSCINEENGGLSHNIPNQQGQLIAESPTPTGTTIPGPSKEYIWLGDLPLAVLTQ
jgi:hypothetical protein